MATVYSQPSQEVRIFAFLVSMEYINKLVEELEAEPVRDLTEEPELFQQILEKHISLQEWITIAEQLYNSIFVYPILEC